VKLLTQYREEARKWLSLCEQRYEGCADDFLPLALARRWQRALDREPLDVDEIAATVREAESKKNNFDVSFHAFANTLRRIYREIWEERLSGSDVEPR
jgi:hypothetical protein